MRVPPDYRPTQYQNSASVATSSTHMRMRWPMLLNKHSLSRGGALGRQPILLCSCRLHDGHIEAGNHPDGGAIFTVHLPLNGHPPLSEMVPQALAAGL